MPGDSSEEGQDLNFHGFYIQVGKQKINNGTSREMLSQKISSV